MLPVVLPTVLVAAAMMAATLRLPRLAAPRTRPDPGLPAMAAPSRLAQARAAPLDLAFQWQRDGFTLDVAWRTQARRLCILGASGSGKSATLRLIAGLDRPDAAHIMLDDRDLAVLPPHARGIAYVPQSYGLLPHLPMAAQIRFGAGTDPARVLHWTARLGLDGLEHRLPSELSLGQQQRVSLARALARPAALLLLDEPFSALDAPLRARLRAALLALQAEIDATTILVTHDPAEAMLLADELLLLSDGRVLQSGPAEAVFQRPVNAAAARLLGADNIAPGQADGPCHIDVGGVSLPVSGPALPPGPVGWAVRPGSVRLDAAGGVSGGVPGRIHRVGAVRAGRRHATFQVGQAMLEAELDPGQPIAAGPCRVSIDPAAFQVWPG